MLRKQTKIKYRSSKSKKIQVAEDQFLYIRMTLSKFKAGV